MSAAILEQDCPACRGRFTVSPASRRKKVQCPQCREAVTVAPTAEPGGVAPEWQARCEMLQARIEALEQQVEALLVAPRTPSPFVPERMPDFSAGSHGHRRSAETLENSAALEAEVFSAEPPAEESAPPAFLTRNFSPPAAEIALLVSAGDSAARRIAETLPEILARAGWTARGVSETHLAAAGLTLAVAPAFPLPRVMGILHALRAAGFAVAFQLDPARGLHETALLVGSETHA